MSKATPQRRVLATAASQIGYSRWTDPKHGTKYARQTQPVFWPGQTWLTANGVSYCDIFITWVFWKALGAAFVRNGYLPAGASYNTDYRASKGGRVSKSSARPGDVLVFDWNWSTIATNHVGILEKRLSGSRFQTIEGNTSSGTSGSQSNGGRVARRVRRHDQVRYVIRPNWSKAGGTSPALQPWEKSATIQSMSKADTKMVQKLLAGLGYSLGSYGVDGSYGKATYTAVQKAQKALGLTVDGVAGPKTIKALTGAGTVPKGTAGSTAKTTPAKNTIGLEVDGRCGTATISVLQKALGVTTDGRAGHDTWLALQKKLDAPYLDGVISRQSYKAKELGNGIVPGKYWGYTGRGSKGSQTVKLLQKRIGVPADGVWGEKTTSALQRALQDGKL